MKEYIYVTTSGGILIKVSQLVINYYDTYSQQKNKTDLTEIIKILKTKAASQLAKYYFDLSLGNNKK